jgi:hypothetical protein
MYLLELFSISHLFDLITFKNDFFVFKTQKCKHCLKSINDYHNKLSTLFTNFVDLDPHPQGFASFR